MYFEEPPFSTWTGQPLIVNGDLYRFGFCTSFVNFLPLDTSLLIVNLQNVNSCNYL